MRRTASRLALVLAAPVAASAQPVPPAPPGGMAGAYQVIALGGDRIAQLDQRDGRVRLCRVEGATLDARAGIVCSQWSASASGMR